ncbi:MAG TPA: NAD(P)/FAD-dependent oxidoreductase, partial [Candidatus Peribacteraceae bacterium]|nr:NAD(P)/FAD-dependent oxidoreductase [Candidatus Peribacteraceae bacterium]
WVDRVKSRDNVVFVLERNLVEVRGEAKVTGITLDKEFEGSKEIKLDGVFIEIGSDPSAELAEQLGVALDKKGFISVKPNQESSVPGVFAAGDNTNASNYFAQFTTAAGEGAVAANGAFSFLQTQGAKGGYMSGG